MDISDKELREIPDELRYKIVDYIDKNKGRPKEIEHSFWYRIKKRERRVSDNVLRILFSYLSPSEYAEIVSGIKLDSVEITNKTSALQWLDWTITRLNYIIETYPDLRQIVADSLHKVIAKVRAEKYEVTVTPEMVKKFEVILLQRGVSKKTYSVRLNYLRRALDEMGWVLSEEKIQEFMVRKQQESATLAQHYARALKLFINKVLKDSILYNSFKTPTGEARRRIPPEVLDIDFHRKMFNSIAHLGARAYYLMLAETGWRPIEIFKLKLENMDLEKGIISLRKETKTKRAYITFLHPETLDWLKKWYLPFREDWVEQHYNHVKNIGKDANAFKQRFFPFTEPNVKMPIKEAVRTVKPELVDGFTLYYLRHFWSTWMRRQNAPADIVNMLQGRAPPNEFKILVEGYTHYSIEDLRRVYEQYAPRLLSKS
ncbi:MAG: site-specific integrase [Sulfolobus sp.]|nr:site-specific integrase [Sulfolobus sp.]